MPTLLSNCLASALRNPPPKKEVIKSVQTKKNIGFGNGIMSGIQSSKGKIIGYTHADRQTDPNDFYKCIKIVRT